MADWLRFIYTFMQECKPTIKEKVEINKYVRENIQDFIQTYVRDEVCSVNKGSKDGHAFVSALNNVWTHYQIFVFAHNSVAEKFDEFYVGFHKMGNAKEFEYNT